MNGLVLEGGALRGLFSAGVTDVMMRHGIHFDGIVGVSAGAAFGCNIKSHQPGRALRYNQRLAHDWHYCSLRSWLTTGDLFGSDFCYHEMPRTIDVFDEQAYTADPTPFYAVCTDIETGRAVYKELPEANDESYEWLRASASMPICSRIVKIGGYKLLDGGVSDSIPLAFFQQKGYRRNVVVLTQPPGYRKQPNRMLPLMRMLYRRYPHFVTAMTHRHEMYNAQLDYVAREEQAGRAWVIRPPQPLPIGHVSHDPDEMQRTYDIGRTTAEAMIGRIKDFLNGSADTPE